MILADTLIAMGVNPSHATMAVHSLSDAGIFTFSQLKNSNPEQLQTIRHIGPKTCSQIILMRDEVFPRTVQDFVEWYNRGHVYIEMLEFVDKWKAWVSGLSDFGPPDKFKVEIKDERSMLPTADKNKKHNVYLSDCQWERFMALGGSAWLRNTIDEA